MHKTVYLSVNLDIIDLSNEDKPGVKAMSKFSKELEILEKMQQELYAFKAKIDALDWDIDLEAREATSGWLDSACGKMQQMDDDLDEAIYRMRKKVEEE